MRWVEEDGIVQGTIIQSPAPSWALDRIDQQTQKVTTGNNVYAAGYTCNSSPARLGNPTYYPGINLGGFSTITVGATDRDDVVTNYSNIGPCVDIFAPGDYFYAMTANGTVDNILKGTSFSAPLVTGVAAIHMQRYAMANSPSTIEGMIKDNSTPNVLTGVPANTPNLILWNGIDSKRHACCTYP